MRRLPFGAAALALALACTPDFDSPSTVKDLRVLAVNADTPEVLVDVGRLATITTLPPPAELPALLAEAQMMLPDSFPPVTLTPLIADPRGEGREVELRVAVCGDTGAGRDRGRDEGPGGVRDVTGRGACRESAVLASGVRVIAGPDGELGWQVAFNPTKPMLAAALATDTFGAVFGLPLSIELTAAAPAGTDPLERVIARKRVVFMPRLAPDQVANKNPIITRLSYRTEENGPATDFDLADPLRAPPTVSLGGELWLEPEKGETEKYLARNYDRATAQLLTEEATEALRYAFFATAGSFSPGSTTTDPPVLRDNPVIDLKSKYEAPATLDPGQSDLVHIWVVTRDERAGSSWVKVAVRLVP
jgi:hypothetical protein